MAESKPKDAPVVKLGAPIRAIVWGSIMKPREIEERLRYSLRLFLEGALRR